MRGMCISSLKAQSWRMKSSAFDVAEASVAFDSLKNAPTTQKKGMKRCWHWCCGEVFSEGNRPEKSCIILSRSCVDGKTTQLDVSLGYTQIIHLFWFIYFHLCSTETDSMKEKTWKHCLLALSAGVRWHHLYLNICTIPVDTAVSLPMQMFFLVGPISLMCFLKICCIPHVRSSFSLWKMRDWQCVKNFPLQFFAWIRKDLIDWAVSVQSVQVSSSANA